MWALKNKIKKRAVKASVISATTAATNSAPTFHAVNTASSNPSLQTGTASLANSQAASAAVADLTAGLDFVFDDPLLIGENEPGDLVRLHLERLSAEAAKYANSRLVEGQGEEWTCSHALSKLLQAACRCSSMVYNPSLAACREPQQNSDDSQEELQLDPVLHRTPSMMGTFKAASMWKVPAPISKPPDNNSRGQIPGSTPGKKTLIVAIRGTATKADHMVNMNGERRDVGRVFNLDMILSDPDQNDTPEEKEPEKVQVQAHAGFLTCALAILPTLKVDIAEQLSSDPAISDIVFTGHSAGGAVASLVFLSFATSPAPGSCSTAPPTAACSEQYKREEGMGVKYSLLTFGSAPSVSIPDLSRRLGVVVDGLERGNVGIMMALVNEYDMVSRADGNYLRSVVDLYRGRYGLPPVSGSCWTPPGHCGSSDAAASAEDSKGGLGHEGGKAWLLPPPVFHLVGDIVLLSVSFDGGNDDDILEEEEEQEEHVKRTLRAEIVSPEVFTSLLFCDIGIHRKAVYLERMEMLVGGSRD